MEGDEEGIDYWVDRRALGFKRWQFSTHFPPLELLLESGLGVGGSFNWFWVEFCRACAIRHGEQHIIIMMQSGLLCFGPGNVTLQMKEGREK